MRNVVRFFPCPPLPLPYDLCNLVRRHAAASCIQFAWTRWFLYGHARRGGKEWTEVRAFLGDGLWRRLFPYSMVRREWRQEPCSWFHVDDEMGDVLAEEAEQGWWGNARD
jgi:hypothetical protein